MAAVFSAGPQAHLHPTNNHVSFNPFLQPEPVPQQLAGINQNAPLAESVEVTVMWGTHVLAALQLTPPRPYAVGEVGGSGGAGTSAAGDVDFAMSS